MKVGILGAGQLGRMLAQAGTSLGHHFRFLDPATEISAAGLGEHHCAAFEDVDALAQFADGLDVVTYEFENVPVESARWLAERLPVHPNPEALRVAQDRLFEKTAFNDHQIPTADFAAVYYRDEFDAAVARMGLPVVIKTRRFGYDGKGQRVARTSAEKDAAWKDLRGVPLFVEKFVPFQRELSIIAARSGNGAFVAWPLVENHHRTGILRLSLAPAEAVAATLQQAAESCARRWMEAVGYVGVLAIEFFEVNGELVANEMAPRVHNSGHWTMDSQGASQFANHVRAITDASLERTDGPGATAMINLIGDLPCAGAFAAAEAVGGRVHLYGKSPRAGRKIGHSNVGADDFPALMSKLKALAPKLAISELTEVLETRGVR